MRKRLSGKGFLVILGCFVLCLILPLLLNSGTKSIDQTRGSGASPTAFVVRLAPTAQELGRAYGVKPSVLLGQAILASDYGRNLLASKYRNLYATPGRPGRRQIELIHHQDGRKLVGAYQVYPDWEASMLDYLQALAEGRIGEEDSYERLATAETYQEASAVLAFAGDQSYADRLIAVIEQDKLTQYD